MKVLVATTPGAGHVGPVVPVVHALRQAGHEVLWVTAAHSCVRLSEQGVRTVPAGMDLAARLPAATAILEQRTADVPPPQRRPYAFTAHFADLAAPEMLPGLRVATAEFGPDVIVREPAELASTVVAAEAGVPAAVVGFGALVPTPALEMAAEAMRARLGTAGGPPHGDLYLHPLPASMDPGELPPVARRVRLGAPGAGSAPPPAWLAGLGAAGPAVYVTFGTEFGPLAPWPEVLDALGELGVDALATTGGSPLPGPAARPERVRVEPWVDQALVFDRVAAVLSHGGAGTVLGAAAAGLPQVCMPLGADQFDNAAALARTGSAVVVPPDGRSASALSAALRSVLDEPGPREAAATLAMELAALPGADAAARWIAELADSRHG